MGAPDESLSLSLSGLTAHLGASLRSCILFSVSYWDPFQLIWQFAVQQSSPWGSGWILDSLDKFHFTWLLWYKWFMILQRWWGLLKLTFPHGLVCSRINTQLYHHGELPVPRQLHLYPQQLSWRPGSRAQSGGGQLGTWTEDNFHRVFQFLLGNNTICLFLLKPHRQSDFINCSDGAYQIKLRKNRIFPS